MLLAARDVTKTFRDGHTDVCALRECNFSADRGEVVWIRGESGSGKTTLLNVCGLLTRPTTGTVVLDGVDVSTTSERERDRLRGAMVGFVFQSHNLIPFLSAAENVALGDTDARAYDFGRLGLAGKEKSLARTMSGGEQQRVAVARALTAGRSVLLADEPISGLDATAATAVLHLLAASAAAGSVVVIASHQEQVGSIATRTLTMSHGSLA